MVFFKTEVHYEYMKKVDDKFFVDPLFYSAYQYARKALIDMFPDNNLLNNIETEEKYYSLDLNLKPVNILKESRVSSLRNRSEEVVEVYVSKFFFELIEVMPYYINYRLYDDVNIYMPELENSLKGPQRYNLRMDGNTLTEEVNMTKNRLYKRGLNESVDVLNINFLLIYLGLGETYFPTVTSFNVESVEDYLQKLKKLILDIRSKMDNFTPSRNALLGILPSLGNETRASFFNALTPTVENFDEYLFNSTSDISPIRKPFYYPVSIEKKETNSDAYLRSPSSTNHLITEDESFLNKIKSNEEVSSFINVSNEIEEVLSNNNYNMNLIYLKSENEHLSFRKVLKHENVISYMRNSITSLRNKYKEILRSA